MRLATTCTFLVLCILAFGQSSSTHYQSNIRGSTTSGNIGSSANTQAATVSIWTEGHEQTSTNYTNASVAIENKKQTSGVEQLTINDIELTIYPNPSHDLFNITTDLTDVVVIVRDLTGKEVFRQSSTKPISSFNWEQGLYLITVESGNVSATTRVLKM